MSTCPEKDLHSIYLDGELPEEFLKEYETHVAGCEKCQAELEKLKKVSVPFREDALSVKLDQTYLDQSFARLQTKMRFKETAERCEKSYIIRSYIKWVSGFAAAAAGPGPHFSFSQKKKSCRRRGGKRKRLGGGISGSA